MKAAKRKKLESAGWKVGSTAEFLGLCDEEAMLVSMKLALASNVKERRSRLKLTQQALAKRLGSSQSRIAKIEAADPSVSLELLVRSAAALGATRVEIGKIIGAKTASRKRQRAKKSALANR
jgi:DNA-binding XRE family transcriptional regulator